MTVTINAGCILVGAVSSTPASFHYDTNKLEDDVSVTSSSEVNVIENDSSLLSRLSTFENGHDESDEASDVEKVDYRFVLKDGNRHLATWNGSLHDKVLYLEPLVAEFPVGCREAFVELLDYAEETLGVRAVLVCIMKSKLVNNPILRLFMFLGFEVVHHSTCPLAPANDAYVFMAYSI